MSRGEQRRGAEKLNRSTERREFARLKDVEEDME
jgi:hypothetical protein